MPLTRAEIVQLLRVRGAERDELFGKARGLRAEHFGDGVILRGVMELTNLCRVNCHYCPMRRDNTRHNQAFIMTADQIVDTARAIQAEGIDIVFMQAGEIPQTTQLVASALPGIRALYDDQVEVLLNLGSKPRREYVRLRDLGATSYILKHETANPVLHQALREESLDYRLIAMRALLELGYRVGTGMISGLPLQTDEDLADDILLAAALDVDMCSVSPFVPAPDTPLGTHPAGDVDVALNAIAVMRLVRPDWLIPSVSALEKNMGAGGQSAGLEAGANVMTINFTPDAQRDRYLIYGKDRFVVRSEHARRTIAAAGLRPARSVFVKQPARQHASVRAGAV